MVNCKQRIDTVLTKLFKLKKNHIIGLNLLTLNAKDPWIQEKIMKKRADAHDLWAIPLLIWAIKFFVECLFALDVNFHWLIYQTIMAFLQLLLIIFWIVGAYLGHSRTIAVRSNCFGFMHTLIMILQGFWIWIAIELYDLDVGYG